MSRKFQQKNKDLVGLEVVDASKVWVKDNGHYKLNSNIKLFGRVEKGFSSAITISNKRNLNHKYVDDFNNLPKNCKNTITDMFLNKNRKVAYLIKKK